MIKKRVVILTYEFPPLVGGVGTYCMAMATAASELGHDVTVLAPDHGRDNGADDAALPFRVERLAMPNYSPRSLAQYVVALVRLRVGASDVVLLADWPLIVAARVSNLFHRLRYRVVLHGTDALLLNQARLPRMLNAGRALAKAERIVANSAYTLSIARREHPFLRDDQCAVALLGVSPYWFEPAGDPFALRTRLGIPADRRIVLSVSRLDERKGHRHMLATLDRLDAADKNGIVYVIVGRTGDPAYEQELKRTAAMIGLPVVFAGGLANADVRTLYSDAYLFFLLGEDRPDKVEGFGLVFLEAAAQGTPSLASPIGGVPEVVLDGETGVLTDWRDPATASAALSGLLNEPERRNRLGSAARQWARTLTWRLCATTTFELDPGQGS